MSNFLDSVGLTYLWGKIKATFVAKADISPVSTLDIDSTPTANSSNLVTSGGVYNAIPSTYAGSATAGGTADRTSAIPFGEVDSTSTSTAYTATVAGITELVDGTCVLLQNGVVTSAANFTININGLGAKPSYNNMATGNSVTPTAPTRDTTIFNINYTMLFVYSSTLVSGGAWICYRGYDANTNTVDYQLRTNSYILNASDGFRYYVILFTSADGTKWVPANSNKSNSATTAKTVVQTPINPFGEIVYCGNSTNYSAGSAVTATAIWQQYTVTLGYSFNRTGAALTLTTKKPVYIKCAPQADGSAIIDSTTPYVQDLPTTDDGKIYILLGMAYSATAIELLMNHPVYYHKDGAIRVWTNAVEPEGGEMYFETTYADLVAARNNNELVAGAAYRITDYVTTVDTLAFAGARSAQHPFDIIVWALDDHTLSEDAKALQHSGDSYFANSNLATWEIKYKLDNVYWSAVQGLHIYTDDSCWFAQAGTKIINNQTINNQTYYLWYSPSFYEENGGWLATTSLDLQVGDTCDKLGIDGIIEFEYSTIENISMSEINGRGTITRLKDEFNNECFFDFKNIQFKRWNVDDAKQRAGIDGLYMGVLDNLSPDLSIPDETDYIWCYTFSSNKGGGEQEDYSLGGHNVYGNVFGNNDNMLFDNVMFGDDCYSNTFGNNCRSNTFGTNCSNNTFANYCSNNTFNDYCSYNSFGANSRSNTFGGYSGYNIFGNECTFNYIGGSSNYNIFGNNCNHITFGSAQSTQPWFCFLIIESNQYLYVYCSKSLSSNQNVRNIKIAQGINNTTTYKTITIDVVNATYQIEYKANNSQVRTV